jgi:hypothetical protein
VIDDHQKFFQACRHDPHRNRPAENGRDDRDDRDDHDDHPDPGLNRRRLADARSSEDDDLTDHNDNHGPGSDDSSNDDDGHNWRNQLNRMRRKKQLDPVPENNEDDPTDDDQDLIKTEDDTNADFDMQDDVDEDLDMNIDEDLDMNVDDDLFNYLDDRSSSPVFVPHSRQTSPETIHPNDRENFSEINSEDFSETDIKLEPKVEPDETEYHFARPEQTHNVIDLTEDSDESTSGGSSIMEVIDLTEDQEPMTDSNRDRTVIDLTQDSDASLSPMDVIELDG